jgi:tryptophan synthase alpha chain
MSRISRRFSELRERGEKALVPFITGGDPGILATDPLVLEMEEAGADIVEIGIPFSDPLADGRSNQAAYTRALERGVRPRDVLEAVARIRRVSEIPIVLMTYFNPVVRYGLSRFAGDAAEAGVDGIIATDLTPEEAGPWVREARRAGLDTIFLLAPTSTADRIARVCELSSGFVYCVSRVGITGAQASIPDELGELVLKIRSHTDKPVVVGFGISSRDQVQQVCAIADGAVVGSALVDFIHSRHRHDDFLPQVGAFVRELKAGTRPAAVGSR